MAIPSECKMPDLSSLYPLIGRLFVQLLVNKPGFSKEARLYQRNYVRLVDLALREYAKAREAILAEIAVANRSAQEMSRDGRPIYFIEFTDHIEICITVVWRLYRLLDRLKREEESPIIPRELRRLVETIGDSITNIRDAIHHMDERINKGEVYPGVPVMATVNQNGDGVVVSKYEIEFKHLAMVLEKMHEIALYILTNKKIEAV